MLTRIEIDGFKTFEAFRLDLSPFVVILGPNASGKSNLFDAIQFLCNLASKDLREAIRGLRGEADELFRHATPEISASKMRLAVEVLVDPDIRDPWGTVVKLKHTRIYYEVVIERRVDDRGVERLVVAKEEARPILALEDRKKPLYRGLSEEFREAYLKYARRTHWLETKSAGEQVTFVIRQDGKQGRTRPAHIPQATVLSSITTTEFPHLFALREEMRSWRFLQLDPAALRRPSPIVGPEILLPDGSNLAAVLARIEAETREDERPKGDLADIAAELSSLIPGVLDVEVEKDRHTREYRAYVRMRDGHRFPTRVISDGTLRVLALLTILYDPKYRGLICFEEPENGVHPSRLKALVRRLSELVSDTRTHEGIVDEPLTQLIANSHSPVVLSSLESYSEQVEAPGQVLFADLVAVTEPRSNMVRRKTRIRPVIPKDQGSLPGFEPSEVVSRFEVERYLSTLNLEV